MTDLPDKILTDLGRVVIKAADLESALGVLAGHTHGLNMMDVLGRPGGALRAARRAVDDMQEAEPAYIRNQNPLDALEGARLDEFRRSQLGSLMAVDRAGGRAAYTTAPFRPCHVGFHRARDRDP